MKGFQQKTNAALSGVGLVNVRGRVVAHQRRGASGHLPGQVGVQVQRGHYGRFISHGFTDGGQQVTRGIVFAFRQHRPVHREVHAVHRQHVCKGIQNGALDVAVGPLPYRLA